MDEQMITTTQAEMQYGITRRVIRRLHERGLITLHKRVGERSLLMRADDLEAALKFRRLPGRPFAGNEKAAPEDG